MRLACLLALIQGPGLHAQISGSDRTVAEQYLFQSINAERTAIGVPALHWNESLNAAARGHAQWLRRQQSLSHQFAGEQDLAARAAAQGARFSRVSENIAMSGSMPRMHTALMESLHHRENILDPAVTSVGIAVLAGTGEMWGVEDFARDVETLTLENQEQQVTRLLVNAGVADTQEHASARRTCAMETGFDGPRPMFVIRYTASNLDRLPQQLLDRVGRGGVSRAAVGACAAPEGGGFTSYNIAVLLYR